MFPRVSSVESRLSSGAGRSPPGSQLSVQNSRGGSPLPAGLTGSPPFNMRPARDPEESLRAFSFALSDDCPPGLRDDLECPVCAETVLMPPLRVLPCSHRICQRCLLRFERNSCPLCRATWTQSTVKWADVSEVQNFFVATCRYCSQLVPIDHVRAFRHLCPSRREAFRASVERRRSHGTQAAIFSASSVAELSEMIRHGHDIHETDRDGCTVLHMACQHQRIELVPFLQTPEGGKLSLFQPNKNGLTSFDFALFGVKSKHHLAFVVDLLKAHPDVQFHVKAHELAAQRGNLHCLEFLCERLATREDDRRGYLLRRMFNEAMAGVTPVECLRVLRRWFPRIEEVELKGAIVHGALSVFGDIIERRDGWQDAVTQCFSCSEPTSVTHRIFAHELFDRPDVKDFISRLFLDSAGEFRVEETLRWLHRADVASVDMAMSRGLLPTVSDARGVSLLHLACKSRNCELVEYLTAGRTIMSLGDTLHGDTTLHFACEGPGDARLTSVSDGSDAWSTIRFLLSGCASAEDALLKRNHDGITPINCADAVAQSLIETLFPSIDDNSLDHAGIASVHAAASLSSADGLRRLIHIVGLDRLDLNRPCANGFSAVHHAAYHGNVDGVLLLLELGSTVADTNGQTVLHHAAAGGKVAVCRALLNGELAVRHAFNLLDRDAQGRTALELAPSSPVRDRLSELLHFPDSTQR